jgi:hypothetical protein
MVTKREAEVPVQAEPPLEKLLLVNPRSAGVVVVLLKLVQKALNHADIKTTTKYAHVVDDEVAAGLDAMQKSRRKSRKPDRKVS